MESFWTIVSRWEPIGQGIFFLLALGGLISLIQAVARYIVIAIRGWPPEHVEIDVRTQEKNHGEG